LYIAGRVLGGTPKQTAGVLMNAAEDCGSASEPEEFAAEKIALLRQLGRIERETGWKTSERARDLRVLWGLEN
jgi:hypothetical protein